MYASHPLFPALPSIGLYWSRYSILAATLPEEPHHYLAPQETRPTNGHLILHQLGIKVAEPIGRKTSYTSNHICECEKPVSCTNFDDPLGPSNERRASLFVSQLYKKGNKKIEVAFAIPKKRKIMMMKSGRQHAAVPRPAKINTVSKGGKAEDIKERGKCASHTTPKNSNRGILKR